MNLHIPNLFYHMYFVTQTVWIIYDDVNFSI